MRALLAAAGLTGAALWAARARRRFPLAAVVGKMYPPHQGHVHVIRAALRRSERVRVFVVFKPAEDPPGELRAAWVRRCFPDAVADGSLCVEAKEDVYHDDANSALWARVTRAWLGGAAPDAVFTSEAYGDAWARELGPRTRHVCVDLSREAFPVSGTQARRDPASVWGLLPPHVRSYYSRVFCVVGPESTGKSVLVGRLAEAFGGAAVPEAGRELTEIKAREVVGAAAGGGERGADAFVSVPWTSSDFFWVAREQASRIHQAREAAPLVFADNDALAACVWHERYMGFWDAELEKAADEAARSVPAMHAAVYLLTAVDGVPFVQDGLRDGSEEVRRWMQGRFAAVLRERGARVVVLEGSFEDRFQRAKEVVRDVVKR